MALEKLAIRGIRSFDNNRVEVIQFFSPVTVIVGHNGSGKTTIIECLKYATTGDQPPNTRGGAFIHDPKMAAEKEVKAQVKLRFRAANGKTMLATRNLSVTVKKTAGLTMKTLEGVLSALPDENTVAGKRATISTKCADMDAEIPALLGVSKAVLENVIFCHQEDSYWPLAEASVLKKKFDDIFESSKYSKALDAIKNLRKERVNELKIERDRLEMVNHEKARADKMKGRLSNLAATIAAKEMEYENLRALAETLAIQNKEFYERATKFRDTFLQAEAAQERKKQLEEDHRNISNSVNLLDGSEEELEDRLRNFERHLRLQNQGRSQKLSDLRQLEDSVENSRQELGQAQKDEGKLVAEEQAYLKDLSNRDTIAREMGHKYSVKGLDQGSIDKHHWIDFLNRLTNIKREQKEKVDDIESVGREKMQEFTIKLQELHSSIARLQSVQGNMRTRISDHQRIISEAESSLDQTGGLELDLRNLSSGIIEKRHRIESMTKEIRGRNFEKLIDEKTRMARKLEDERERLANELASTSHQMQSRANLDLRREEADKYSVEMKTLLEAMTPKYREYVGQDPQPEAMERILDRTIVDKERDLRNLEAESNTANRKLHQLEANVSSLKTQLKQKEEEAKSMDKKLATIRGEHPDLESALTDAQEQLKLCREEAFSLTGATQFYNQILKNGQNKKICTGCNRKITSPEMPAFEKYLSDILAKGSAAKLAELEEEVANWDVEVANVQQAMPLQASFTKLKIMDIPALKSELIQLEASASEQATNVETVSNKVDDGKTAVKGVQYLKQQAFLVLAAGKKRESLLQVIKTLELSIDSSGSAKSLQDIQAEMGDLQARLQANEREKQGLIKERDHQHTNLRTQEAELHPMELEESDMKNRLKERERQQNQIKSSKEEISSLVEQCKEIEINLKKESLPIERVKEEQTTYQRELNGLTIEARDRLQEITASLDKLESVSTRVEDYRKAQGDRKLKGLQAKLISLQESIEEQLKDVNNLRQEMTKIDTEIASGSGTMANLRDNIRLRKLQRDIAVQAAKMASLNLDEASKARQQFEEKYSKAKEEEEKTTHQAQHLGGELTSLRSELKTCEADIKEYKDINARYTAQLVKVKMSDMVNNDLEKYAKALDSAIMKYHSLKMEEVNDTMRHLWNNTYQGTDIDGIKIVSEGEGASGRRTYNYRVVMTKDQVEMDMRGRCSAGQKMLASIIIRLALSDSFGANCGILALDEPTNALDTENIEALASSLVDIIRERREQANFQLIIITHDESFLKKLGEQSAIEYYWRVSRDARQKSTLSKHAING